MKRIVLILLVSVSALAARPAAQVRIGLNVGGIGLHANLGHQHHHHRVSDRVFSPVRRAPVVRTVTRTGYYKTVHRRVYTRGFYEVIQVPARYEYRVNSCGLTTRVLVSPACSRRVYRPGCWRTVPQRVLVCR